MSPLVVIAGPTASGKTALAIDLAERLNAEIISADSQQVYRHFDIGTAKPSAGELARVPHHLVSCVDPLEPDFSAARWARQADEAIAAIRARGKEVVVVGGTGLYLRALLHGLVDAPPRDEALRAALEAFANEHGNEALHGRLVQVDPATAARHPAADRLRVIRALEIHTLTGKPASEHHQAHGFEPVRHPHRSVLLLPEREPLYARINARTRAMFDAGLIEEVRALVAAGYRTAAPMRAVGYAEALEVVDGRLTAEQAMNDVAQATRHYAKRQYTWFKKERGEVALSPSQALELLTRT